MRVVASWWVVGCLAVGIAGCGGSPDEGGDPSAGGEPAAARGERVTLRTPGGKVDVETHVDLATLGVAIYPGAQLVREDGDGLNRIETPEAVNVAGRFRSDASIREIADWYAEELAAETSVVTEDSAMVMAETEDGLVVQVICSEEGDSGKREFVLSTTRRK